MVRLIDADAIPYRDELKRLSVLDHDKYITAETLEYMLDHAPTIDAVPVVRCKDCIYWDRMPSSTAFPQYHACRRPFVQLSMEENGFCSWAVKKMDEVE